MTDFTAEEIEAALYSYDPEDDSEDDADESAIESLRDCLESGYNYGDKPMTLKLRGEDVWYVFKIGDQLFRKEGAYASHYGTDWDGKRRSSSTTSPERSP